MQPSLSTTIGPMRVTVADSRRERCRALVGLLTELGLEATGVHGAHQLYRHLFAHPCDLVLLDTELPDEDGLAVARYLRRHSRLGIAMISSSEDAADRLRGLAEGADAYLVRPLEPEVVAATLISLGRRVKSTPQPTAPRWQLLRDGWQLAAPDGQTVELTTAERTVMSRLLESPEGEPVERDCFIADLSDGIEVFDNHRLEMIFYRLRRKVRERIGRDLPLRSIRSRGYLFHTQD